MINDFSVMNNLSPKEEPSFQSLTTRFLRKKVHSHKGPSVCTTDHLELAIEIEKFGDKGLNFLLENLDSRDGCRFVATLGAFGSLRRFNPKSARLGRVRRLLVAALKDQRFMVVCFALQSLEGLRAKIGPDVATKLLAHWEAGVSAAALRYLCRVYPRLGQRFLLRALHDRRHSVRSTAVDEIDDADLYQFEPELRRLSKDRHAYVRDAARLTLKNFKKLRPSYRLRLG